MTGSRHALDRSCMYPQIVAAEHSPPVERWRPKLTAYRLLVSVLTIAFGTGKALASVSKNDLASPVTLDWISGIVVLLLIFFLSEHEATGDAKPDWLFQVDIVDRIRALGVDISPYITEERLPLVVARSKWPAITAYRLLVTLAALCFGVVKASLCYRGHDAEPAVIDWVYGVVVTILLYWLGLYERSSIRLMPWLFEADYVNEVYPPVFVACFVAGHLAALYATHSWTIFAFKLLGTTHTESAASYADHNSILVSVGKFGTLTMAIGLGIGFGVAGSCFVLASLGSRMLRWLTEIEGLCFRALQRKSKSVILGHDTITASKHRCESHGLFASCLWLSFPLSISLSRARALARACAAPVSVVVATTFYLRLLIVRPEDYIIAFAWTATWFLILWKSSGVETMQRYVGFTFSWTLAAFLPIFLVMACICLLPVAVQLYQPRLGHTRRL